MQWSLPVLPINSPSPTPTGISREFVHQLIPGVSHFIAALGSRSQPF